ncbi:MAG TPA: hypothetical protein VF718_04160 [Allosphingosinicella sp.]|jgi:hypothetical protein
MRIIHFPAAALGAAAIAAAASAQPASNGHGGHPGASIPFDVGRVVGERAQGRPGWGMHRGRGHGRRGPGFGRGGAGFPYPFAAYGIDGEYRAVDAHGTGFFAGAGGRIRMEGGRPYYDYDRAYPYEWASSAAGGPLEWRAGAIAGPSPERCSLEKGVRVCRGRD